MATASTTTANPTSNSSAPAAGNTAAPAPSSKPQPASRKYIEAQLRPGLKG
ncbi:MAG TPA: hypothetical protein VKE71_04190 [Candidatus Angelobacter sp.]|nr:hypothetical protein [Candidatus Angelobacter sp.]